MGRECDGAREDRLAMGNLRARRPFHPQITQIRTDFYPRNEGIGFYKTLALNLRMMKLLF